MSKFKTIQQQGAEKTIEAMFTGLEDDIALKTVLRVMYGLEDESVLEELKRVNEANLASLTECMTVSQEEVVSAGKVFQTDTSGNLVEISQDSIAE